MTPDAQARALAIASAGLESSGRSSWKTVNTRSAQSAAHLANRWCSGLGDGLMEALSFIVAVFQDRDSGPGDLLAAIGVRFPFLVSIILGVGMCRRLLYL
jgi:hypothetical protein